MKGLFLTGIAALFLATGARADPVSPSPQWPSPNFTGDCRRDRLMIFFDKDVYDDNVSIHPSAENEKRIGIYINLDKAARARLEKELQEWKRCDKYYQCLEDRDAGKVKHCYANDKRWRGIGVDGL
jgi:hypothetical protein